LALLLHSALALALPVSTSRLRRERLDLERRRHTALHARVPEFIEPSAQPSEAVEARDPGSPEAKQARP